MKDLFQTDWEKELQPGDIATRKENGEELQVVLLAGLQRLARSAGLVRQEVRIQTPSDSMIQAIFEATFLVAPPTSQVASIANDFSREVRFVGTADCSSKNTSGKFLNYPTAVAESRAEARCLRKALGIKMLSSEEIGLREGIASLEASPTAKVDSQIVIAIEKLCETRGIEIAKVLEEVIEDDDRAQTIFDLSELTTAEAQRAMAWLNDKKPSQKKLSAQEQRDQRKQELLEKKGKS